MPLVLRPMDSSFSACRERDSTSAGAVSGGLRSAMSRLASTMAIGTDAASRSKVQRLATAARVPSLRVWTSSPSHLPVRISCASIWSSGTGKIVFSSAWPTRPTASPAFQP